MDKPLLYGLLIFSIAVAWLAVWNHYNIILTVKEIKPSKWRGDDRIFLAVAFIAFVWFSVAFFML